MKKIVFLLTIGLMMFGCGAKQDVFKINDGSKLSFNQEIPIFEKKKMEIEN